MYMGSDAEGTTQAVSQTTKILLPALVIVHPGLCVWKPFLWVRVPIIQGESGSNPFAPQSAWRKLLPSLCFSGNGGVCFTKWDHLLA